MKKVDEREKLIELLETATFGVNKQTIPSYLIPSAIAEVADHLIANGVTLNVRDCYWATEQAYKNGYKQGKQDAVVHARWERNEHNKILCTVCKNEPLLDDFGFWSMSNCCPSCGAKVDGQETKSSGISQRTVQALERMGQKVHGGDNGDKV